MMPTGAQLGDDALMRRKPRPLNSIVALLIISAPRLASSWWICQYERMATVMLV
jgi:hypothetical protein